MFTGDRSGDFLYAALHRAGLASRPESRAADDGLVLPGAFVTNACRCAPPGNRPAPDELARCAPFLDRELEVLRAARVVVALGAIAWDAALAHLARRGAALPRPRPRFAHGAEWFPSVRTGRSGRAAAAESRYAPGTQLPALLGTYHPSRQNTNTGRLTPAMLDAVLARAVAIAGG